jgi:Zn-dependent protease with chaperone function
MKTSLRYKTHTKYLRILAICGIILSIFPCLMICVLKSATGFIGHPWLLLIVYFVCNVLLYPLSGLLAFWLCKTNTLITVVTTWILYNVMFVLLVWLADTFGSWWLMAACVNFIVSFIPQIILLPIIYRWIDKSNAVERRTEK